MYGELNFNPVLFVSQMKYVVLLLVVGTLITLFAWGTYMDYKEKKFNKEKETETC